MNRKQFVDALKGGREDAVVGMLEQFVGELEQASQRMEAYEQAAEADLKRMADSGDSRAGAYYVAKRIDDDQMTADDLPYLDRAVDDDCLEAASLGAVVYGLKNSPYKDRAKELNCLAQLEQYGDKTAHKRLKKAASKETALVAAADRRLLEIKLAAALAETVRQGFTGCTVVVSSVEKGDACDPKNARSMTLCMSGAGRDYTVEDVYTFFRRDKTPPAVFAANIRDRLAAFLAGAAPKLSLQWVAAEIEGTRHRLYGGSEQAAARGQAAIRYAGDVDLQVDVVEKGRLQSRVCPICGAAARDEDGKPVCPACGSVSSAPAPDNTRVEIADAHAPIEALICTQCAAQVELDASGKTALCPACGTTFAVNGEALTDAVFGLDFASLEAAKPAGEALPEVRFMRAHVFDDRVSAVLPKNFIVMPDDMVRIKYKVNPPEYIYTTPDSKVNLCFRLGNALPEAQVFEYGVNMLTALKNLQPGAKFGEAEKLAGKHNVFFIDFITPAADQPVYNAMFFFSVKGRQCMGSWNCPAKDRWFWAPVFKLAVRTMDY